VRVELARLQDRQRHLRAATVHPTDAHQDAVIVPVLRIGTSGESVSRNTQS
jgi:hypothetical protein